MASKLHSHRFVPILTVLSVLLLAGPLTLMLCGCQGSPAKDLGSAEALQKAWQLQEKLEEVI